MDLSAPGLENDLIRLAPLAERFREDLRNSGAIEYMWLSLPAIQRGAGFDSYFDHVLKQGDAGEVLGFALLDPNDNGRFVGVTALMYPNKMHRRVRLGYTWLEPHLRGLGVYAAIQKLLIQRALDWGAKRIEWYVEERNTRAIRAIESIGALKEGVLREYEKFADGEWVDVAVLSMLRDEAKSAVHRLDAIMAASET
ncbi:MAG: GNAT family N-acetyltransferase [Hyphomonas sp.]|jgi:RimJ/RimL family protein N-acetyltransferase|nr:GNAT family N-acetyltransferase [Alphaproteobacteria bacterium]MCR9224586.1 GNAT family N-acetyltransferase [Hyphomonas sp.]